MRPSTSTGHFIQLLAAIFFMSSSGTMGRYIVMPPEWTIWLRCFIGALVLGIFLRSTKTSLRIRDTRSQWIIILSTILLGIHWISYFHALARSTVALGMLSLFVYPTLTATLEPIILKTKFEPRHLILALIALYGVYLLVPEFTLDNDYTMGILIGIGSALAYSFRNIFLKSGVANTDGTVLMFYQLLGITVIFWPLLLAVPISFPVQIMDHWEGLLILGIITTAIGHTLFVRSFRHFNITAVSIISNLTPLFGILLGFIVLGEVPQGNVVLGGLIILSTTVIEGIFSVRNSRKS